MRQLREMIECCASFPLPYHHLPATADARLVGSSHQYTTILCFPDGDWAARDISLEFELNELPESQNYRTWLLRENWIPLLSLCLPISC